MTSLAVGNVVRSGMMHLLLTPHTEESTTRRGGLVSLKATPSLPTAMFGYAALASSMVPLNSKTQP